jgi:hypothetical protein
MTLGNGFAGKKIIRVRHVKTLPSPGPNPRAAIGRAASVATSSGAFLAASPDRVKVWAKRWDDGSSGG